MTKEEVLQKANDYCSEKGYTSETLTDEFKDKFSSFFSQKYPDVSIDDENAIADLKFNLNTAFSATSRGITLKMKGFESKEQEYKRQIEELNKKISHTNDPSAEPQQDGITKELQEKLERLERFEAEARKSEKLKAVLDLAKKAFELICTNLLKSTRKILRSTWMKQARNRQRN